jgi:hypothetical protein
VTGGMGSEQRPLLAGKRRTGRTSRIQ